MDEGTNRLGRISFAWGLFFGIALVASTALAKDRGRQAAVPEDVIVQPPSCITSEEQELARLINEYRGQHGLAPVPLSTSLTEVAKSHVFDLKVNNPTRQTDKNGKPCSLHSWSQGGPWNAVCYTRDQACAEAMWEKPRELTGEVYRGNGFENAYWTSRLLTPRIALEAWKKSSAHNDLILQKGCWRPEPWNAMGVALSDHFAVLWFGDEPDPLGEGPRCGDGRSAVAHGSSRSLAPGLKSPASIAQDSPALFSRAGAD